MNRLELLRLKLAASSYGQALTFVEQRELERLEDEMSEVRQGRPALAPPSFVERRRVERVAEWLPYDV